MDLGRCAVRQALVQSLGIVEDEVMIQPSVETMLEDMRFRGDRQHPFWAKVETR